MSQNNIDEEFDYSIKIGLGFLALFLIFFFRFFYTLIHLSNQSFEVQQQLSGFKHIQWATFISGVVLSIITIRWIFLQHKYYVARNELFEKLKAINKSQAIIEFDMNGTILSANNNFLHVMGYTLDEIVGKPHSLFIDEDYKASSDYKNFWDKLKRGEYDIAEYKRIGKNGREVWLQSSYNPILDRKGKPIKVIKFATDITLRKIQEKQIESMAQNLQEIGKQIIANSSEISVGIKQLEETANNQASSSAQQAASVSEICTTIEEIKVTSQQTLQKATELGESAKRTSNEGEKGRDAVEAMGTSMQLLQEKMQQISSTILSLNDRTQQISEITEAVADIAKQSKMLALNASIEAAKAGESGKGFAVVAGEVKDLAEKSQNSTNRVQKILQDIRQTAEKAVMVTEEGTKSVDENIKQVQLTGKIINSLGEIIEESSMASLHIVSAIREESIAIDQVDESVKEINKVTSFLGVATEQTKEAITGLSAVADSLMKTARAYVINDDKAAG
jgi:methyl-accepting chemotaxis protein